MPLKLSMDPSGVEQGSAKAKAALEGVKGAAIQAESAIDKMGRNGAADMAPLATNAERAAVSARKFATEAQGVTRATQATSNTTRMLGQQLSQVAQQGAVTGNYLGALAVQLPDMALGFGSVAIAASIVATIALPLLITAFGGGKTAAELATDATDLYSKSLTELQTDIGDVSSINADYVKAFTSGSAEMIAAIGLEAKARQAIMALDLIDVQAADKSANDKLASQKRIVDGLADEVAAARAAADKMAAIAATQPATMPGPKGADVASPAANAARMALVDLDRQTKALTEQQDILARNTAEYDVIDAKLAVINAKMAANKDILNAISNGLPPIVDDLGGVGDKAQTLSGWLTSAWGAADGIGSVDIAGSISAALGPAQSLYAYLSAAAGAAAAAASNRISTMDSKSAGYLANQYSQYGAGHSSMDAATDPLFNPPPVPTINTGSSGGGGGGSAPVDQTRAAYDSLLASLDPVVAKTQEMAKATATANAALAAHDITAAEHAHALDLIRDKYAQTADAMSALKTAGTSALDGLINGTKNLSDSLRQMARDLVLATIKAQLLKHVTGGTDSMSFGGLIMQAITGGVHDNGGTIPMGTTGLVGERGPELVTAGSGGAVVTSRVDTARLMGGGKAQDVRVSVDVGVTVDDDGKVQAYVRKVGRAAAESGAARAVQDVKRNLGSWNTLLSVDGALA